jgi:hypothetical protein
MVAHKSFSPASPGGKTSNAGLIPAFRDLSTSKPNYSWLDGHLPASPIVNGAFFLRPDDKLTPECVAFINLLARASAGNPRPRPVARRLVTISPEQTYPAQLFAEHSTLMTKRWMSAESAAGEVFFVSIDCYLQEIRTPQVWGGAVVGWNVDLVDGDQKSSWFERAPPTW